MKTKIISFALILLLSSSIAIAQSTDKGKMSFAILGGVNLQNLTGKDNNGDKLKNDMLLGFHGGVNLQIPIVPEFYFQPGLLFSTKGAKSTSSSLTSTIKVSYVELPLNLVYKGKLGNGYVMVGFGPYVAYGIGGKVKTVDGALTVDTEVAFQNVVQLTDPLLTTYFKALDAGGNIFAGFEMEAGLFFQLNTQFGMLKINPENKWVASDKSAVKNMGFGLSLGYRF